MAAAGANVPFGLWRKQMAKAKKKVVKKSIPDRILATMAKNPTREMTTDKLAQRIGEDQSSVSSACTRLYRAKKLTRAGATGIGVEARYKLPSRVGKVSRRPAAKKSR